ncbi:MAG: ribosome maturation factor RimP [Candidatus Dormibacteria bacterium]
MREAVVGAAANAGCELWAMHLAGPKGKRRLQVLIDAPGGIDLQTCAMVSRGLRSFLDEPFSGLEDVDLEVSSPGAERRLNGVEDLARYVGRRVNVTFKSGDSETVVEGPLLRVDAERLAVVVRNGSEVEVALSDVIHARGAVDLRRGAEGPPPSVPGDDA